MRRFGNAYGQELEEVPVPVGELCAHCLRKIEEDDEGLLLDSPKGEEPWHMICLLDTILGSRWAGSFPRPRTEGLK